jgi:hypothetical protein
MYVIHARATGTPKLFGLSDRVVDTEPDGAGDRGCHDLVDRSVDVLPGDTSTACLALCLG